ncbi:NUDIX domain-containing protein [Sphingomonas naphthae]|uniref:GDP-mannose pyrophosphatase n=1 Tax=Sphingomonas naphthae TaxID=1813468 RepID=A0ABY7TKZ5_9SPHN|nr:NUDIX domain-containing protein [Sphingomonas naphthae]WCT73620.1 NUDIX domain-containing protein [Sphingomonas naphthae]
MNARIVRETIVYQGWMSVTRVAFAMPDGEEVERHFEDHGDAVAVLAYDEDRRTALLVTQPRPPVVRSGESDLLEVIAGGLEPAGREYTVRKEALEEAGVRLGALEPIVSLWSMPTISTERLHLFLAPYALSDRIGAGGGAEDENEAITVVEMPLAELAALAGRGKLTDAKTLVLVQALQLRRPTLFAP